LEAFNPIAQLRACDGGSATEEEKPSTGNLAGAGAEPANHTLLICDAAARVRLNTMTA